MSEGRTSTEAEDRRVADAVWRARVEDRIKHVEKNTDDIKELFEKCVTQIEFKPVKAYYLGQAGLILTAVIVAVVALVVK